MGRNRFVKILNFADNATAERSNRLFKIDPFIQILSKTFSEVYKLDEYVCIDESVVPFRRKVIYRKYIKRKRHKYGIKLYKLCFEGGYMNKFIVYAGKN